jgi:hypothetical protein
MIEPSQRNSLDSLILIALETKFKHVGNKVKYTLLTISIFLVHDIFHTVR